MYPRLYRENNVSENASERKQTLSKNIPCESIAFTPGIFISNTQKYSKTNKNKKKTLLLVLPVCFMAGFSDEKSSAALQEHSFFVS